MLYFPARYDVELTKGRLDPEEAEKQRAKEEKQRQKEERQRAKDLKKQQKDEEE